MFQVKSTVSVMNDFWANLLSVRIQITWDVAPCFWDSGSQHFKMLRSTYSITSQRTPTH